MPNLGRCPRSHPHLFVRCPFWQYGTRQHHSEGRAILGSVVLPATAPDNSLLLIRHLVLDGSSQWVVGRNVTSRSNILHMDDSFLVTTGLDGAPLRLPPLDRNHHLLLPQSLFAPNTPLQTFYATPSSASTQWSTVRSVIDRVHKHVCGHSYFSDMETLLVRTQN